MRQGPLKAQKALQGAETETRELLGGTEKKSVSPKEGSLICPPGKSMIFLQKRNRKNELVVKPGRHLLFPERLGGPIQIDSLLAQTLVQLLDLCLKPGDLGVLLSNFVAELVDESVGVVDLVDSGLWRQTKRDVFTFVNALEELYLSHNSSIYDECQTQSA